MTLRFFYQRSVKTNLKFGILILVIVLTARLIECDDEPTEAPAGGEATEAETEEGHGTDESKAEPRECPDLYITGKTCSEMDEIVFNVGAVEGNKPCIITDDRIDSLCQLMGRCGNLTEKIEFLFAHSVMPKEGSDPQEYVLRNANLTCTGLGHQADDGQMLSESLWLIYFAVVGGLMIYSRYTIN